MKIAMFTQWYDPEGQLCGAPRRHLSRAAPAGPRGARRHGISQLPQGKSSMATGSSRIPARRSVVSPSTARPSTPATTPAPRDVPLNYLSFAAGAAAVGPVQVAEGRRGPRARHARHCGHSGAGPAGSARHSVRLPRPGPLAADRCQRGIPVRWHLASRERAPPLLRPHLPASVEPSPSSPRGWWTTLPSAASLSTSCSFVPNWADEDAFRPVRENPALAAEFGLDRPFTVMYAGIFGKYQNLGVLVEAARTLRDRRDIGFALVGGGVEEAALRAAVARHEPGQRSVCSHAALRADGGRARTRRRAAGEPAGPAPVPVDPPEQAAGDSRGRPAHHRERWWVTPPHVVQQSGAGLTCRRRARCPRWSRRSSAWRE